MVIRQVTCFVTGIKGRDNLLIEGAFDVRDFVVDINYFRYKWPR